MEPEDPIAVMSLELRKLTEVVMRFASEFEAQKFLLAQHCGECKEIFNEVRTSQKELQSKLLESSKIYVFGDVSAYESQSTAVHSQESSSLVGPAKGNLVDQCIVNHQQNLEKYAKDVVGPGHVTSNGQFNDIHSQTNLKLIQLVEAAALQVAREDIQREAPTENSSNDNQVLTTPSQVVPQSGSSITNEKRLCCTIPPSPSIYATDNDYRRMGKGAEMDMVKVTPANKSSYPIRTPPEKLLRCEFCPRVFEHHHSAILHSRSCKKIHDESRRLRESDSQENVFTDLITVDQKIDAGGGFSWKSTNRRSNLSRQMQKMIQCGHCERTFPTQHQVSSHERVHTGLRPYSCYVCGVKFAHGGNMIKHIKSKHPSANPYMCRYCQNNFKTHADVLQHRKLCAVHRSLHKGRIESSRHKKTRKREGDETVTASEDENSRPWAARLPCQPPADLRQIKFDAGPLTPPISIMTMKTENEETVVTSSPPMSLGQDNSAGDEGGSTSKTFESEILVNHSAVAVNQLGVVDIKEEVDFLPD